MLQNYSYIINTFKSSKYCIHIISKVIGKKGSFCERSQLIEGTVYKTLLVYISLLQKYSCIIHTVKSSKYYMGIISKVIGKKWNFLEKSQLKWGTVYKTLLVYISLLQKYFYIINIFKSSKYCIDIISKVIGKKGSFCERSHLIWRTVYKTLLVYISLLQKYSCIIHTVKSSKYYMGIISKVIGKKWNFLEKSQLKWGTVYKALLVYISLLQKYFYIINIFKSSKYCIDIVSKVIGKKRSFCERSHLIWRTVYKTLLVYISLLQKYSYIIHTVKSSKYYMGIISKVIGKKRSFCERSHLIWDTVYKTLLVYISFLQKYSYFINTFKSSKYCIDIMSKVIVKKRSFCERSHLIWGTARYIKESVSYINSCLPKFFFFYLFF